MTALAGGGQPTNAQCIPWNQYFTNVGTVGTTGTTMQARDSIALPDSPVLFQPYTVFNSGLNTLAIFPGSTSANSVGPAAVNSKINNYDVKTAVYLAAGATAKFVALSNTALAGTTGVIQWVQTEYTGPRPILPIVNNAANTLTSSMHGCIITIPVIANNSTLAGPAVFAGMEFDFLVQGTLSHTMVWTPTAAVVTGILGTSAGAAAISNVSTTGGANASLTFTATGIIGDSARVRCDGTSWHVIGFSHAAAGMSMP